MTAKSFCAVLSVVLIAPFVGCGSSGPPGPEKLPVVPAAGTVNYQGNPVANADVAFQHSEGKVTATAKTDSSGHFTLKSYATEEGAPAGTYKVTVSVSGAQEIEPGVLAPEPPGGFKSPIPAKYGSPTTSDLKIEIPAGGSTDIKIELN